MRRCGTQVAQCFLVRAVVVSVTLSRITTVPTPALLCGMHTQPRSNFTSATRYMLRPEDRVPRKEWSFDNSLRTHAKRKPYTRKVESDSLTASVIVNFEIRRGRGTVPAETEDCFAAIVGNV